MHSQDPRPPEQLPVPDAVDARDAVLQRRRRMFLRAGAGVVPVSLTLASRPVRAWHCNTSSAWGSAQINLNASTLARNEANDLANETWSIANWKANSTRAGLPLPWTKVKEKWFPSKSDPKDELKISHIFPVTVPAGLSGSNKVWSLLNDQNNKGGFKRVTLFQKYMIVAKLNATFIPNVAKCLMSNGQDQLSAMIDGTYQPSNIDSTGAWNETKIMEYLTDNYIVVQESR